MRSRRAIGVLIAALALVTAGCGGSSADTAADTASSLPAVTADPAPDRDAAPEIQQTKIVTGASSFTTPPLYTFAADGRTPSGVLIQLIENAAAHMGITVTWSQIPYAGIVPAMDSGKVDLSGSQFSATAPNLAAANILAVYENTVAAVVPADDAAAYPDMTGACGRRFAIIRGSTIEPPAAAKIDAACAAAGRPALVTVPFAGSADALTAIRSGRVDGFLDSAASAAYAQQQSSGSFASVLVGNFDLYPSGFAVQKDKVQLARAFEAAFDAAIKDGSYGTIMKNWNMPEDLYATQAELNPKVTP